MKYAVDHNRGTRWLKKFHLSCKNLDNQARSGRPKNKYSETVLQAIQANLLSSTERVSSKIIISKSSEVHLTFKTSIKVSGTIKLCLTLLKYYKILDSPKY